VDIQTLAAQAKSFFSDQASEDQGLLQPVPGMLLLRHRSPTPMKPSLYEPVMCLILQGRKETIAGDQVVHLTAGESMVVSHDTPVLSRITRADPREPYLAVIVTLDMSILRGLYEEVGDVVPEDIRTRSLAVHSTDPGLLSALARYLALAADPVEARVLLPLVKKELHFRLLMAPHGGMLRRLLRHDSHASHVARAIAHLRANFRTPFAIPDLASSVGMSSSSLHKHFKQVTSTTPLQYLKDLRLLEARRLLGEGEWSVSTVAFEVGYESPNQFSREYSRKFGVSPRVDRRAAATTT
jgi:AraC-like DNA-binding protein